MSTPASIGLLALRLVIAVIMFFHGTQKLFGWWHGQGLDGATEFFARQGFRPPRLMAVVAALTETAGSLLLGLGLLTPLGVAMITGVLTNVAAVHVHNGLDVRKFGMELELALLGGTIAVGCVGAGDWSVDHALGLGDYAGLAPWAVPLGIVGGLAIIVTRDRSAARPPVVHP
jgi:putative oxidoreductase